LLPAGWAAGSLRSTETTLAKLQPKQATELRHGELQALAEGLRIELQSCAYGDGEGRFNGQIKFALEDREIRGCNTWFVYGGHAEVLANGRVVYFQVEH